jgi:hypothetical protein
MSFCFCLINVKLRENKCLRVGSLSGEEYEEKYKGELVAPKSVVQWLHLLQSVAMSRFTIESDYKVSQVELMSGFDVNSINSFVSNFPFNSFIRLPFNQFANTTCNELANSMKAEVQRMRNCIDKSQTLLAAASSISFSK